MSASRGDELRAALHAAPDNLEAWRVYGDWLQTRGDPRGELIAVECALLDGRRDGRERLNLATRRDTLLMEHFLDVYTEALNDVLRRCRTVKVDVWSGFLVRAQLVQGVGDHAPGLFSLVDVVCNSPGIEFLRELHLGFHEGAKLSRNAMGRALKRLVKSGPHRALQRLHIELARPHGTIGLLTPLYVAAPNLKSLSVRGNGIDLGVLEHPCLEQLVVETPALSGASLRSVADAQLPRLRELTVYLGSSEGQRRGVPGIDDRDLARLCQTDGLSALEHLGLPNYAGNDALIAHLVASPLLRQVTSLDLSMGGLTDAGAEWLLEYRGRFAHLESIDLAGNMLDERVDELREAFGRTITLHSQRDLGPGGQPSAAFLTF